MPATALRRYAAIVILSLSVLGPLAASRVAAQGQYVVKPLTEMKIKQLPPGPLYWRVETFATIAELAALHFATAQPGTLPVEIHQVHDLLFELAPQLAKPDRDGRVRLPEAPGLGIALPPGEVVRRL